MARSRCPREGTRVRFAGTPAAVAFYQGAPYPMNRSPKPGEGGSITSLPGPFGKTTCLAFGPGGGMVYVDWDQAGTIGVLRAHLEREGGGKLGGAARGRRSRRGRR